MKKTGDVLYWLGIILIVSTFAVPMGMSIFISEEAGATMAMLGLLTFWPGLILLFAGAVFRRPPQINEQGIPQKDAFKRIKEILVIIGVIILIFLALANIPMLFI